MSGEYEKPITIERAIQNIARREYLLPAIQRKFEWDADRICALFDSIMRNYPINTFMMWRVDEQDLREKLKFYEFLPKYCEHFFEDNPDFETRGGHGPFYAVIDGQQRLTSLYIGLRGTFATKLARKHRPKTYDEMVYPPKRLYLNLSDPLDSEANEGLMEYDFRFLSESEFNAESKVKFLYRVGDVLDLPSAPSEVDAFQLVDRELKKKGWRDNDFSLRTLTRLYSQFRRMPLINYYLETDQGIDHVLNVFVRTNKGGKPLAFSDLLMSIAIANWQQDAREQIDNLVKSVWQDPGMGFEINRDFVLKAALTAIDSDIRFKVANFSQVSVAEIERQWKDIKSSIVASFRLLKMAGIENDALRAKNAVIPIVYYLFHKGRDASKEVPGLHADILKLNRHQEQRATIVQWLVMSTLKGVFGGHSDTLLASLRKTLKEHLHENLFPLAAIVKAHEGTTKDLLFDDAFAERLLKTQKDDPMCYPILALLMPAKICTEAFHKDHLHPKAAFIEENLFAHPLLAANATKRAFYADPENWNSIANLHLLDSALNTSKQDQPLDEWMTIKSLSKGSLGIPDDASLAFEDFESFVKSRTAALVQRLKEVGRVRKV